MQMSFTRGTTPTIRYEFHIVDPAEITVADLTIKQGDTIRIEKALTDATAEEGALTWLLTQAETLMFSDRRKAEMQLRYRLRDGSAHATRIVSLIVLPIQKDGEI